MLTLCSVPSPPGISHASPLRFPAAARIAVHPPFGQPQPSDGGPLRPPGPPVHVPQPGHAAAVCVPSQPGQPAAEPSVPPQQSAGPARAPGPQRSLRAPAAADPSAGKCRWLCGRPDVHETTTPMSVPGSA